MENVTKGKDFENKIAELYRIMGYLVEQNVGILGHQIDLILTYNQPGGVCTRTAIECKYVENGNLTKNDAMNNINALVDLKRNEKVQSAVIVTTNGFSKDIWDTARENNITLLTFCELQHQILKLDSYLDNLIKRFEDDELSKYYVNIFAQEEEKGSRERFLIDDYVYKWIDDSNVNHLSILGEYGTGKTSFCRKLTHDLAIRYKKDKMKARIPILINLRDYSKVMSIRQLITDLLINEYGIQSINFPLFEKMNEEGLFLLVFDGFDEMAQKVMFDVAYANFSMIAELAKPKKSKVVLTCRVEFFRTHEKEREILIDIDKRDNFDIVYLQQFSDEQIKTFLQKRIPLIEDKKTVKKGWEYYYQKIHDVFDLSDLAKRPVLLDLVVKYLPELIQENVIINAATLYKTAISEELKRRLKIGTTIIQRDDRLKLMKLLAAWMYNNDKLFVYYEQIPELLKLKDHFDLKTSYDIEYHLNDFLTCSFLNRDATGNYRFSHKSLVDFLVAWKLADDVTQDNEKDFLQKPITYEVVQFIKDLKVDIAQLRKWVELTRTLPEKDARYLGGNSVTVLNELGEDFKNFDFSRTKLDNAKFDGLDLRGLNFKKAMLRNASLDDTLLEKADFSGADLTGVSFEKMGPVYTLGFDVEGKILAGAGYGKNIRLWGTGNLKERANLRGHHASVSCVAFSPDGKYLASGSHDNTIILWNTTEKKEIERFRGHSHNIKGLAFSPNSECLASAGYDGVVIVWGMSNLELVKKLYGHNDSVLCVAYSPDGKYLASGSQDNTIILWNAATLLDVKRMEPQSMGVRCIAFNPNGRQLACIGMGSNAIEILDVTAYCRVARFNAHVTNALCCTFSPDGRFLVSGGQDGNMAFWRAEAGFGELARQRGHQGAVNALSFSPDGKYLASAGQDGTIRLWSFNKNTAMVELIFTFVATINCNEMIIENATLGLDLRRLLIDNGAIDNLSELKKYAGRKAS